MTKKEMQQKILSLEKQLTLLYNTVNVKNKGVYLNMENNLDIKKDIEKTQINIFDVANYIIKKAKKKQVDDITNLKLNKLVYYCYAKYLVDYKKKLFSSPLQAWRYGPVFPELYHTLKPKRNQIVKEIPNTTRNLDLQQTKIIDYVFDKYGSWEPCDLTEKTHEEDPWYDVFPEEGIRSRRPMNDSKIFEYYSKNNV